MRPGHMNKIGDKSISDTLIACKLRVQIEYKKPK